MAQCKIWENEYKNSKLLTKKPEPQKFIQRFYKFLKTKEKIIISGLKILDLGCGTGRNSVYFAKLGAEATGIEISPVALNIARAQTEKDGVPVKYILGNIGEKYNLPDNYFNIIIDATSSNSLNEKERSIYLEETNRVLKKGGYFFVRALCLEGDKNAKKLLKISPGGEYNTYIMPGLNLTERVFSKEDIVSLYSENFKIIKIIKETSYTRINKQSYKRNFWIVYLMN